MEELYSEGLNINYGTLYGLGECADRDIIIPEGVTHIARSFGKSEGLEKIRSIVFPSSLKDIEVDVFNGCKRLTRVEFKDGFVYSRARLFAGLQNLEEAILPSTMKAVLYDSFRGCSSLRRVVIPEGVEEIGQNAFLGCGKLEEVTIPKSVKKIDSDAFKSCKLLQEREGCVTYVCDWVIACDTSAERVSLREGTVGIGALAFLGCEGLKEIKLPESLEYIGDGAFEDCTALEALELPTGLRAIGEQALYGCESIRSIAFPAFVASDFGGLFGEHPDGNNCRYVPESIKEVRVSCGEHLPEDAFIHCENLESITLPDELKTIGDSAFMGCRSLTEIKIPKGVTEIGHRAFFDCVKLESIELPEVLPKLGISVFYNTKIVIES